MESSERPEAAIPPMRYVMGETRYMKIQKPGKAVGGWNTPAKRIIIENKIVVTRPAVVASGSGVATICAKTPAKT